MRPKKCIYKISYQCICITVKKRKCNTCSYITVLQWIQISPRGGNVSYVIAYCLATTQTRTNNSRTAGLQFQDFPGFSKTYAFFQDFPEPGILNNKIPRLSRIFTNPAVLKCTWSDGHVGYVDRKITNWVKVLHPTRHRIGHFGDVLLSQSLGLVLKKTKSYNKSKHASATKYTTT